MIICRSEAEIERLHVANQVVADVLAALEAAVAPGVTTADLDRMAERMVRERGAVPAFIGESRGMQEIRQTIERIAPSDAASRWGC